MTSAWVLEGFMAFVVVSSWICGLEEKYILDMCKNVFVVLLWT